jgi:hypothetical protein
MAWEQQIDEIVPKICKVEREMAEIAMHIKWLPKEQYTNEDRGLLRRLKMLRKYHSVLQKKIDQITIPPHLIVNCKVIREAA